MPMDLRELWQDLRDTPVAVTAPRGRLRALRISLAVAWLVGLAVWVEVAGPPMSLQSLLLWLSLAMLVASIGNPLGWAKGMLIDWCPLYVLIVAYDIARGLADNFGFRPHVDPQLSFDQMLFGEQGATHHLQQWLGAGQSHWWDDLALVLYLSHFLVTIVVCAVLWSRSREQFLAYRRRVVVLWLGALTVFAVYPSVPPWMAADQGHLPPMHRVISALLGLSPSASSTSSIEAAAQDGRISVINEVAAIPSMHAALPLLLLLFVWHRARRLRIVLVAYTLAMGLLLVYSGEHFVFDVLAGWAAALAAHAAVNALEARRANRVLRQPADQPSDRLDHDDTTARPTTRIPSDVGTA